LAVVHVHKKHVIAKEDREDDEDKKASDNKK
jgi:hypothetical protein